MNLHNEHGTIEFNALAGRGFSLTAFWIIAPETCETTRNSRTTDSRKGSDTALTSS
jgi:hypothetical protein